MDLSIAEKRSFAVAKAIARIRKIEQAHGVSRAALDRIRPIVTELAMRTELFPREHFPLPAGARSANYHLAEDADHRFFLMAAAARAGQAIPPHNHTTWGVISGIHGEEHNVIFQRSDGGDGPGPARLARDYELTVKRGNAVGFLPDEFHAIAVADDAHSLHLHMYGMSLEHTPNRLVFDSPEAGSCRRFRPTVALRYGYITAPELKSMIRDGRELAILDVREEGVFGRRHLLLASNCPLSSLELRIAALVPRRGTRIVLCDDDGVLTARAAQKLVEFGYTSVSILARGVDAWASAGHMVYSGVHVPSKAFGEFVEHHDGTPRMEPTEIKARVDAGEDIVILDSRPMDEYRKMSIPGAMDCPGAELVYRTPDLVPRRDTLVVVNCAGRTRSIIGAQSLINAGLRNRVVALKNGTMGWHLAGLELAHGRTNHAPPPGPEGLARAKKLSQRIARRFGVRMIDVERVRKFAEEMDKRTLYLLDVRSPEEYAAGHLPCTVNAPGGQLVQETDAYMATRNARVLLIDDHGVRATMTAHWLIQMGWKEVYVVENALSSGPQETGAAPIEVPGLERHCPANITPTQLDARLRAGDVAVVDLDTSLAYRGGHIPGAWFAIRSRFATSLRALPAVDTIVLTSPDGIAARLAADEAFEATGKNVLVLAGGTAAWKSAGLALATGLERMLDDTDDLSYKAYDRTSGIEQAMQDYLSWEVELVRQIERDDDVKFLRFPGK